METAQAVADRSISAINSRAANGVEPSLHARILTDARRALGLEITDLARRLGTTPAAIRALETGDAARLPPWPETVRVVTGLLGALGMDPRPVLHALSEDLHARRAAAVDRPAGRAPAAATSATRAAGIADAARRVAGRLGRRGRGNRLAAASAERVSGLVAAARRARPGRRGTRVAASMAVTLLAVALATQTTFIGAAASTLPPPLSRFVTRAVEHLRVQLAPVRDGLRWIEVEDPRSRRGDKLQTARR